MEKSLRIARVLSQMKWCTLAKEPASLMTSLNRYFTVRFGKSMSAIKKGWCCVPEAQAVVVNLRAAVHPTQQLTFETSSPCDFRQSV
jgi:hypothetical protein